MRPGDAATRGERLRNAYEQVRDEWLAQKQYEPLVKAILGNWTSGNCVGFMMPVTEALILEGCFSLHRYAWTRTLKRQTESFFRQYTQLASPKPTFEQLMGIDAARFNELDWGAYCDHELAAAFLLQRLMSDIEKWRLQLQAADLSTVEADAIREALAQMKRPVIINRAV